LLSASPIGRQVVVCDVNPFGHVTRDWL
jgi:hypothetical protein